MAALALLTALRSGQSSSRRRIALLVLQLTAVAALLVVAWRAEDGEGAAQPLEVVVIEERGPGPEAPTDPGALVRQVLGRAAPRVRVEVRRFAGAGAGAGGRDPALPELFGQTLARLSPGARSLVLLAGRPAAGDADALVRQAAALGRAGVPVLALAPAASPADARIRQQLTVPGRVFPGERFEIRLLMTAPRAGRVVVELFRNETLEQRRQATLTAGVEQEASFAQTAPAAGPLRYRTVLRWEQDAVELAEERFAAVAVALPLAIEYVSATPESPGRLPALLERAGLRVGVVGAEAWLSAPDATTPGVVVLDDVPAAALGDDGAARLERRIKSGKTGLLVIGGLRGLGSGDYRGTPLERLLPVTSGPPPGGPDTDVALAIVLDTSLSMFFRARGGLRGEEGPRKIEVARLAVLEVVRALRPGDQIGLLASNDQLTWVRRPGPLTEREAFESRVRSLGAIGGGINFYSSIREAAAALREVPSRLRHVMVVADSDDIDQFEVRDEGRSEDLVRTMAAEGISLSIFAIGYPSDKDVLFLKRMTVVGRGDFYLVPDLGALPRFFRSEYQRRTGEWFREEDFVPLVKDFNPVLRGLDIGAVPGLAGLDLVAPRPGGEEVLVGPSGTPLLALWGYGAGRTAVFASDSGERWAGGWDAGDVAGRFWSQLVYALAPGAPPPALDVRAAVDARAGVAAFLLRRGDGTAVPVGEAAVGFGDPPAWQPLARRGVERYEATPPASRASFRITGPGREEAGAVAGHLAPPAGGDAPGAAREILEAIAAGSGGALIGRVEEIERHLGGEPRQRFDPVFWLLLGALLALVAGAGFRE